jgi:hypothetical protein
MNKFKQWYVKNQDAITWFIIGVLVVNCIDALASRNYIWAAVDAAIIYVNFKLRNVRLS